jgi:RNA polymerase sigma-70 factor (ECF subfamily)
VLLDAQRTRASCRRGGATSARSGSPDTVDHAERLALESAIRQLPPEQREVVHLHVFKGWTFQEVADACGESINTIASRYRYTLARLRETLAPR